MTHNEFAAINPEFRAACDEAGIKPTAAQASKYRRGFGLAYTKSRGFVKGSLIHNTREANLRYANQRPDGNTQQWKKPTKEGGGTRSR